MDIEIRNHRDRLSAATQQWLAENPGSLILPRTMVETICREAGITADTDQHGQAALSQADLDFIRTKVHGPLPTREQAEPSGL